MFGDTLRKLRMIYGISAKEFSELLGISTAFLSAIETGRKEPSVEFLAKCADIFEISLSALVLLSESYEKAKADGAGKAFIKKAMHSIICLLSKECDDE